MAFYLYLFYLFNMEEKNRKKTRFQANFDGYFRLKNSIDWQNCYIYDISETGTLLRIKQTLLPGDELEICLDSESRKDIIEGRVANVQGQVAGVEFTTKHIEKIVSRAIDKAFSSGRSPKKSY